MATRIWSRVFQYQPEQTWHNTFWPDGVKPTSEAAVAGAIRAFCNDHGCHEQLRRGKCFTKINPSHPEYLDGDCYRIVTKNKGIIYLKLEFFKQISLVELDLL